MDRASGPKGRLRKVPQAQHAAFTLPKGVIVTGLVLLGVGLVVLVAFAAYLVRRRTRAAGAKRRRVLSESGTHAQVDAVVVVDDVRRGSRGGRRGGAGTPAWLPWPLTLLAAAAAAHRRTGLFTADNPRGYALSSLAGRLLQSWGSSGIKDGDDYGEDDYKGRTGGAGPRFLASTVSGKSLQVVVKTAAVASRPQEPHQQQQQQQQQQQLQQHYQQGVMQQHSVASPPHVSLDVQYAAPHGTQQHTAAGIGASSGGHGGDRHALWSPLRDAAPGSSGPSVSGPGGVQAAAVWQGGLGRESEPPEPTAARLDSWDTNGNDALSPRGVSATTASLAPAMPSPNLKPLRVGGVGKDGGGGPAGGSDDGTSGDGGFGSSRAGLGHHSQSDPARLGMSAGFGESPNLPNGFVDASAVAFIAAGGHPSNPFARGGEVVDPAVAWYGRKAAGAAAAQQAAAGAAEAEAKAHLA